jgi:hypothetical protein
MFLLRIAILTLAVAIIYVFRICLLAVGCALYAYLFPGILAQKRGAPGYQRIYWVCGLSGWLLIPWIAALLWVLIDTESLDDKRAELEC